jgi:hypothetical protein
LKRKLCQSIALATQLVCQRIADFEQVLHHWGIGMPIGVLHCRIADRFDVDEPIRIPVELQTIFERSWAKAASAAA